MVEEAVLSLKPCPFCGEIEKLEYDGDGGFIVCRGCGTFGPDPSNGIPLFDSDDTDEAEAKVNAATLWNKRAHVPTPDTAIPCEFPSCPNEAAYEGWYRKRDPFLGTPTGHIMCIAFCEEHKSHPHLYANEPKKEKPDAVLDDARLRGELEASQRSEGEGITDATPGFKGYARASVPRTQGAGEFIKFPPVEGEGITVTHFQVVEPPEKETE